MPTVVLTVEADQYAVGVAMSGLTPGATYRVDRDTGVETKPVRQFTTTSTSEEWLDVLAPFGVPTTYRLVDPATGAVVAEAGPVELPWSPTTGNDVPLFDTSEGSWPIFRAANLPNTDPIRLPVTDYAAEFGFRGTVMPILGSYWPVVATQPVQAKRFTFVVLTPDTVTRQQFMALLRDGVVFHLRSPCVDGMGDVFFKTLTVSETVPLKTRPLLRQWQIAAQQVARPVGYDVVEWVRGRKWADVATLGTWADVAAEGTWGQVRLPPQLDEYGTRPQPSGGEW